MLVPLLFATALFARDVRTDSAIELSRLLRTRVDISFEDRELPLALRDLRVISGIPILLTPALIAVGDETVTLELHRVPLIQVLRVLARLHDLKFLAKDGAIYATTPEDAVKRTAVMAIYDVRAVTYSPPNFRAPRRMGLRPSNHIEAEPEEETRGESMSGEDLVELIRKGTGESQWEFDGVSIDYHSGKIVVRHTPTVHAKVRRIVLMLSYF
jgi:hypothetical protein